MKYSVLQDLDKPMWLSNIPIHIAPGVA